MSYSPEHLTRRRRARVQRRRIFAATTLVILLAGAGISAYVLSRPHHVVVVHVAAKVHSPPAKAAVPSEYPAAHGAPSLTSVQAELAKIDPKRHASSSSSPGSSTGARGSVLDSRAALSFQRLASSLPGRVELAVAPLGRGSTEALGNDEAAHGWSTTKVPVLVSLIRARGSEGLTSRELTWAHAAITESDNQSVLSLFGDLERLKGGLGGASEYMDSVLRASGDSETTVATAPAPAGAVTTFGQTQWRPSEAVKFFRALDLGCLLPASQTSYVLGLMKSIEPSESWGLGSAGFSSVAFKGGWGPESGGEYLVRQSGIIEPGSSTGVTVAIVAFASSFGAGTEILTRTASWLNHHLALTPRARAGCGGE